MKPFMKTKLIGLFVGMAAFVGAAFAQDPCAGSRDLRLTNGKIHTLDKKDSIVSELTVQNGKITAVGPGSNQKLSPCTKTINLRGRTAVPGLIDNHNHIVLPGMRPGHDIRKSKCGHTDS